MTRTAEILAKTLAQACAGPVFAVPGESYLALIDALYDVRDTIPFITCRHEAGAAHMAAAIGKLTGKPGIAMVTRGPGACHAAIGVHAAFQDSVPMLLLVGQVGTDMRGREAFQEIDYQQMFGGVAKAVLRIDTPARAREIIASACALSMSGRMGPVVVELPEDILDQSVPDLAADAPMVDAPAPTLVRAPAALASSALEAIAQQLAVAARPLLWLGGSGWSDAACADIQSFAQNWSLPVVSAWRRKDIFDNNHALYAGEMGLGLNPALRQHVDEADLIIALGTRLGEVTSQAYALPHKGQKLIHIHNDSDTLFAVRQPTIAAQADIASAAHGLAVLHVDDAQAQQRQTWAHAARTDYLAWIAPTAVQSGVNMAEVVAHLSQSFGPDAIWCNGAGNFAAWVHRFHQHSKRGTQLAPTSGAMGYGVPAAIAAKLLYPARPVVVVAGDGDFMMSMPELATAQQYGAHILVLVVDNGQYGTIRMHQAAHYPARFYGTGLANPDFCALAESFGMAAALVERTEDFALALVRMQAALTTRAALIHIRTDPMEIAPGRRLAEIEQRS